MRDTACVTSRNIYEQKDIVNKFCGQSWQVSNQSERYCDKSENVYLKVEYKALEVSPVLPAILRNRSNKISTIFVAGVNIASDHGVSLVSTCRADHF